MDVLKEEIFLCVLPIATAAQTVGAGRRNMIQYLHGKFQEYYTPGSNIYIDDSIVCFKGQLTFKSFKWTKPPKCCWEVYVLWDSNMFYVFGFQLYNAQTNQA